MRHAFIVAVAALATALAPAFAAEWRTHTYEADGFAIDFSGPVTAKPTPVDEATQQAMVRTTAYVQDGGNLYAYAANASLWKAEHPIDFDAGVKGTMDAYKCTATDSDAATPEGEVKAREIYASACLGGTARVGAKFVLRGQWFYQIVYIITADAQTADGKRFLASFKLLPPKN
jgi:hypothetical protein